MQKRVVKYLQVVIAVCQESNSFRNLEFHICCMHDLEIIKRKLQFLKAELAGKYFVSSIGLFGSIVREDFNQEKSDVDIIADFSKPVGIEFIDLAD